jgi:hypothetical protein
MEAERSRTLLVEASTLITATRSRIARSMTLLAQVTPDGFQRGSREFAVLSRAACKSSSHPPSAPPF